MRSESDMRFGIFGSKGSNLPWSRPVRPGTREWLTNVSRGLRSPPGDRLTPRLPEACMGHVLRSAERARSDPKDGPLSGSPRRLGAPQRRCLMKRRNQSKANIEAELDGLEFLSHAELKARWNEL